MRKIAFLLALLLALLVFSTPLRAQDKIELFGGYSYARVPVQILSPVPILGGTLVFPPGTCPITNPVCASGSFSTVHVNTHGWEFSGAFKPTKVLGVVADFSGHYGSTHGSNLHLNTYLFGPQMSFPGPVSPFAHFLIGAAHESSSIPSFLSVAGINLGTNNAFASALGAGIDIKVIPFVSVRLIQFDYLLTRFGSQTQNQPRASAGIVLHF
jgi:opacity protein-like surface antigen